MRRFNLISIFLITIFSTVVVFAVVFSNNLFNRVTISKISRGFFNEEAVHFNSFTNLNFRDISLGLSNIEETNVSIIHDDLEKNIRKIFIKGKYENPPMKRGRFLEEHDFYRDGKYAVVGKKKLDEVFIEDDKEMLLINDVNFEVVGVMGYDVETILDDMIIISDISFVLDEPSNLFVAEGKNVDADSLINDLQSELQKALNDNNIELKVYDISDTSIKNILKDSFNESYFFLLIIGCCIICSFSISSEWVSRQQQRIAVKRLVGYDDKRMVLDVVKAYFFYCGMGTLIGLFITMILKYKIFNVRIITLSMFLNVICGFLSVILPTYRVLRINAIKILR